MKRRLLLVIALAVFGTAVAASAVGAAQGGLIGTGQSGVEIDLPGAETLPACSNLADDDGDGKVDRDDPGCTDPLDGDEADGSPTDGGGQVDPEGDGNGGTGGGGGKSPGDKGGGGKNTGGGSGGVSAPTTGGGGGSSATGDDGDGGTKPPPPRLADGTPTRSNPTTTIADFGPTPIGVPNFMIDQFSIPPFLLPIYQACGTEYGIPWQVLASINRIETAFGTNLNVSSAGAMGWMQFIPSSWKAYGVDANNDGRKDPYNPVDAICAAARYLRAAGGQEDLPRAIFAYNHADWYVDEVLLYARQYGKLPDDLVGSLTGLTEGAHFPIAARARYADDISERQAARRAEPTDGASGNVADVVTSSATRRGINIYSREGAPVVAVNDGVIRKIGKDPNLGRYIVLQDAYGNRFTYAELGKVSKVHPVPKRRDLSAADFKLISPKRDKAPTKPASADGGDKGEVADRDDSEGLANTEDARERLYALPQRPRNVDRASVTGQLDNLLGGGVPGYETVKAYFSSVLEFDRRKMELRPLREGSKVSAGTVLARVGEPGELASHINFSIRPTGRGAPKIDPKPILDGWKLLEATAIYRAAGKNPFTFNHGASVGQILLMSKSQLERRVLADPRLEIYSCGREDIRTHQIDRRILATLEYLAESGFRLTITSLKCGHSFYTSAGSVSHHSSGNAVDIAMVNGLPILGNQGRGSITESVLQQLLRLQGTMRPAQVISLMQMGGPTFAMSDHADHIHVGFTPPYDPRKQGKQFVRLLEPDQWERLIGRIAEIDNPDVPTKPSKASLPAPKARKGERASHAHTGE